MRVERFSTLLRIFVVAVMLVLSFGHAHADPNRSSNPISQQRNEDLTFRSEGEIASWQILVSVLFVAGLLVVSLGLIALSRRRPGLLRRVGGAGSSIEVLEMRRLSPKLNSVLLRAGGDRLLVLDNGSAIRVHVLHEPGKQNRE